MQSCDDEVVGEDAVTVVVEKALHVLITETKGRKLNRQRISRKGLERISLCGCRETKLRILGIIVYM